MTIEASHIQFVKRLCSTHAGQVKTYTEMCHVSLVTLNLTYLNLRYIVQKTVHIR